MKLTPTIRAIITRACTAKALGLSVAGLCVIATAGGGGLAGEHPVREPSTLKAVADEPVVPELALLMGDLQRLTHKMALSAAAANPELAAFYLHESLEQLKTIQSEAPEYETQPVALLVDRLALPMYEPFKAALEEKPVNRERLMATLDGVIQGCNACHAATRHGFIRITRGTEVNPFNQSFAPAESP